MSARLRSFLTDGTLGLSFTSVPAFVDEVPEVLGLSECFVLAKGELGAEEEVGKGSFVKDAVDDDLFEAGLEVEAPVRGAETVEGDAIALDFSEALVIKVFEVFFGDFEFFEEFELF